MQAATLGCPPEAFRDNYSLADFTVTQQHGRGASWQVLSATCNWSGEEVLLQTYEEGV